MNQVAIKVQYSKKSEFNCVAGASYKFVHWWNKFHQISSPECVTEALAVFISVKSTQCQDLLSCNKNRKHFKP